jgi:Pyruvate/2-oxoacid:ferredoxin oxidoreductase gamma subunit
VDSEPIIPIVVSASGEKYPSIEDVKKMLSGFSKSVLVVNASETSERETGSSIAANVYLLGYAVGMGLVPIKKEYILQALQEKKFFDVNKKIFEMGISRGKV